MTTKYRLRTTFATMALVAGFALGVSSASAQVYAVTEITDVSGTALSEPAAINNQGEVAGTTTGDTGQEKHAFLYRDGQIREFGGIKSRGFDINAAGLVVGDSMFPSRAYGSVSHAAIFKAGTIRDLGVLKGALYSRANGINAFEQVAGFSGPKRDADSSRAFVWNARTGLVDIGTLGGPYAQANAINDAGFVTGTSQVANGLIGATHAFLYQIPPVGEINQMPMLDLQTLGGASSYGLGVNAFNHVVGYSEISLRDDRIHAFYYANGKMVDLGTLGAGRGGRDADYSAALAINRTDAVVGYSYLPAGDTAGDNPPITQAAFIYYANYPQKGMTNLNQLIGKAAEQYWLLSATAINDKGQIVAFAIDRKSGKELAVLLTPSNAIGSL